MLAEQITRVNRSRADASPTCWPVFPRPSCTQPCGDPWVDTGPAYPGISLGTGGPHRASVSHFPGSPTDPEPGSPWALPTRPPLRWLISKFTTGSGFICSSLPPPPPAGSQAPRSPNQQISRLEHVSQGPLSPKTFLRCEFPREGTRPVPQLLGPLPSAVFEGWGVREEAAHHEVTVLSHMAASWTLVAAKPHP